MWRDPTQHRKLLNLITHLPAGSAYVEELGRDPEVVQAVLEGKIKPPAETAPRSTDWSPSDYLLAQVIDQLVVLRLVEMARGGVKNLPAFKPVQRPKSEIATAFKRAEAARELEDDRAIDRMFRPNAERPDWLQPPA